MQSREILNTLAAHLQIKQTDHPDEKLRELIQLRVRDLIVNDFNRLVQLLYKLDVSEKKLQESLEANKETDASSIITELIIERQIQKVRTREQGPSFKKDNDIPENEKW